MVFGFSDLLHVIYVLVVVDISETRDLSFSALLCVVRASFVLELAEGSIISLFIFCIVNVGADPVHWVR